LLFSTLFKNRTPKQSIVICSLALLNIALAVFVRTEGLTDFQQ